MLAGPSPTWEKSEEVGQSGEEESMVAGGGWKSGLTRTPIISFTTSCEQNKISQSNLTSGKLFVGLSNSAVTRGPCKAQESLRVAHLPLPVLLTV